MKLHEAFTALARAQERTRKLRMDVTAPADLPIWDIGYEAGSTGEFPLPRQPKEYYEGFGAGRRALFSHLKEQQGVNEVNGVTEGNGDNKPKEVEPPRVLLADAALADLERVSQLLDLLGDHLQGDARSEALIYFALEGLGYIGTTLETLLTGVAR